MFLIIPGNPGVADFYRLFMRAVYQEAMGALDVVCIAHAGHSYGNHNKGRVFDLQEQIQHKIAYVRRVIDDDPSVRIFLAGHSVGAHICVEVMKAVPRENIVKSFMLFPTVMHIGDTPNGRRLDRIFNPIPRFLISSVVTPLLALLPKSVVHLISSIHLGHDDPVITQGIQHLLDRNLANNALYMARTEMDSIHEPDVEALREFNDKCVWYWTQDDNWAPMHLCDKLRRVVPNAHIEMDRAGLKHAFVIGGSEIMAKLLAPHLHQAVIGSEAQ
eukprot:TRINITY_DN52200_c0_g1_i2.p2 TRINITY_DN52200_c0_g1~~TRINITY_DN52200_c0_g1_i2.p2  ORF type:complete len:273 (-),score=122.65 TRINITY_DN52200_c0_g1_i2:156-974(-)